MIPKVIHYIWLGGKPLPDIANKCITSWQKFCPDYEIKRWDESNLNIDLCPYVRQSYDAGKFAFASDVLRLDILYREGGIYLDIDVELIKPLDSFLQDKAFTGFECSNDIAPGLIFATESGNQDLQNILNDYKSRPFVKDDGTFDLTTICMIVTSYYEKFGLKRENTTQCLPNLKVYSTEYFCPISYVTNRKTITPNTCSIHWYNASWYSKKQRFRLAIKKLCNALTFGLAGKVYNKIRRIKK